MEGGVTRNSMEFHGTLGPPNGLSPSSIEHDTRNATTDQLYIPIYGTVRGQKSFKYVAVRTWNYILQNVNARCL